MFATVTIFVYLGDCEIGACLLFCVVSCPSNSLTSNASPAVSGDVGCDFGNRLKFDFATPINSVAVKTVFGEKHKQN